MAKQVYNYQIVGLMGRVGTVVSYRSGSPLFGYFRAYAKPALSAQNTALGTISKNLSFLYAEASSAWKADLAAYTVKYGNIPITGDPMAVRANSSYAVFIKMMYAYADFAAPNVDLDTLAFGDLETLVAPILTILGAIQAGLLPDVPGSEAYTAHI